MITLLLPGMDGTGALFEPLLRELPDSLGARVVGYPNDQPLGYDALEKIITPRVPVEGPWAMVAESFSGPLAVRLATKFPERLRGLVLASSFVECPVRWASRLGFLAGPAAALRRGGPSFLLRFFIAGSDAPAAFVAAARSAILPIGPTVWAARLRATLAADERSAFRALQAPVLILACGRDRLIGARAVKRLHALRPDARLVTLDAPHMVLQRRPAEAAAEIGRFLTP